jgi:membrane-associated HD superfamily phosphohydrolase
LATPWCTTDDVSKRLRSIKGKNWDESELTDWIARAQTAIRARLANKYSAAVLSAFDSAAPAIIKDLTADWAALLVKKDYINDYATSEAEKQATSKFIDNVLAGKAELIDDDGNVISKSSYKVISNTSSQTRDFTHYHPDHANFGEGSLDDYGPATTSQDMYPGESG